MERKKVFDFDDLSVLGLRIDDDDDVDYQFMIIRNLEKVEKVILIVMWVEIPYIDLIKRLMRKNFIKKFRIKIEKDVV